MCPECREPLIVVEFQGVEIDHCPECRGTWFDAGELEFVLEVAGIEPQIVQETLSAADAGTDTQRRCPRCVRRMRAVRIGEPAVELDVCRTGEGIWLDAGELAALVRGMPGGGDPQRTRLAEFLGDLFRHELTGETEEQ